MKKVSWMVIIAGAAVGLAAVGLTMAGNPANMGFCIACFLRDIAGAVGMHGAAKVQYVRPEIIGLVLGAGLTRFVVSAAEVDNVMFGRNIYWPSFVMGSLLTFLFSFFVNLIMHFRLKKINMVESMKSVD